MRVLSSTYVQLLVTCGNTDSMENCQPAPTGVLASGKLTWWTYVLSRPVREYGRAMEEASPPSTRRFPVCGTGANAANRRCNWPRSILASWNASYRLGQRRSKRGDNDNSTKECAAVSVN